MLKQFAPKASTPPSPKNSAWIASAMLTAITAAQGPSSTATSTPPTACAVVPSGIGTLNIITRKQYAAPIASSGTYRFFTTLRTRRAGDGPHRHHRGAENAARRGAQVAVGDVHRRCALCSDGRIVGAIGSQQRLVFGAHHARGSESERLVD